VDGPRGGMGVNKRAWDNGVEVKRLRTENRRLRHRLAQVLRSRELWRLRALRKTVKR